MLNSSTRKLIVLFSCLLIVAFTKPIQGIEQQTPEADNLSRNKGTGTAVEPYIVPKTGSGIKVDAVLDEKVWEETFVLELNYEVRPGENVTPPVRTEVLLIYDNKNLYAGFRCYDPDPSAIRAHLRDRDT